MPLAGSGFLGARDHALCRACLDPAGPLHQGHSAAWKSPSKKQGHVALQGVEDLLQGLTE